MGLRWNSRLDEKIGRQLLFAATAGSEIITGNLLAIAILDGDLDMSFRE